MYTHTHKLTYSICNQTLNKKYNLVNIHAKVEMQNAFLVNDIESIGLNDR